MLRTTRRRAIRFGSLLLFGVALFAGAPSSQAIAPPDEEDAVEPLSDAEYRDYQRARVRDPHDPTRAMHPVRIAAYALHPVGVAIDYAIVRPSVWVVRQEPFRTIFGFQED
jgi:hypothetical protein